MGDSGDDPQGANGVRRGPSAKTGAARAGRSADTVLTGAANRLIQKRAVPAGGWTRARRTAFLEALASSCNVVASAAAVGLSLRGAYRQRAHDPAFAAAWREALVLGYERLQEALLRLALDGIEPNAPDDDTQDGDASTDTPSAAPVLTTAESVRLALRLLERHRPHVTGSARSPGLIRRANPADTDATLRRLLDGLARRRAASGLPAPQEGQEIRR